MNYELYDNTGYLRSRVIELEAENKSLREELELLKSSRMLSQPQPGKLVIDPLVGEDWDDEDEKTDISDQLSGRIIFSLRGIEEHWRKNGVMEIIFLCGPETKEGYLEDTYDCGLYSQLENLLGQFEISVADAKNLHSIRVPKDDDPKKVWEEVKKVLLEAGAVEI